MFSHSGCASKRTFAASGGAAILMLCASVVPSISQQASPSAHGSIEKQAAGYTLKLVLPAGGVGVGLPNNFVLLISASSAPGVPVGVASVAANLSMPAMAGMTIAQPTVVCPAPGEYHITAVFPHAGEYQLAVTVKPVSSKSFAASFILKPTIRDANTTSHSGTDTMAGMMMSMSSIAGVPEMQQASGTSWQPALSPMYGIHSKVGKWMLMTHYNVSVNYDQQTGPRGDSQFDSTNWLMVMGDRSIGRDELQLRTMLTLEPLTVTPRGYPLLFQSGEQYDGKPLVDRQHPHDLFMEVAARYFHPVASDSAVFAYVAPSGEPSLGPTAFMHRMSAFDMPMAPITHHWMDSTHIDFGVLTLGAWKRNVQVETSYFTGREPDQYRYDFSPMHMDSFSGRLSYNPTASWNTQVSYGYLHSPEALRPGEDLRRTTVSASYMLPRRDRGWWAFTVGVGNNSTNSINSTALLVETELNIAQRNSLFARYEYVNKLGEELALTPADQGFGIGELTLGYVHDVTPGRTFQTGIGAAITLNTHPSSLTSLYGSSPMGFWLFVRIRPAPMRM